MNRSSKFFLLDREINRTLRKIKKDKILNQASVASVVELSSSSESIVDETEFASGDILDNHFVEISGGV